MDDLDRACVGLLVAWTVHDLEELVTMPRESRRVMDRVPQWVPLPEGLRDRGLSQREVALAIASVGAVMAGASVVGLRTRGRSPLFRGAVLAFGLHGVGHLAASIGTRGYTTGVATAPLVVLPYWLHARRVLGKHGLPEGDGPAVTVALAGVPLTVAAHLLSCSVLGHRALGHRALGHRALGHRALGHRALGPLPTSGAEPGV